MKKSFPNYDRANNNQNESEQSLSDDVIDKGDEHNRQITGGPSDSMLFNENPQMDSQIYSVAPCAGQKPLSMTSDENFEEMFNPDNIRGSPPYYQQTFYDLLAMIRQLGTPTCFLTLSSADMKWPDFIQVIAKQHGVEYADDDVLAMSFEEKSK